MATLKGFPGPGRRRVSWGGLPAPSTPFVGWMVVPRAVGSCQGLAGGSGVSSRLYEQPLPK
jgi:hypothetical protein